MLQSALWYAGRGLPVFPLHTNKDGRCSCGDPGCKSPAKHPRTKNGVKDATTDAEQIKRWWGRWPDSNIGMATGGGYCVIDIDNDEASGKFGSESLSEWQSEQGDLPDTWLSLTGGGGLHYLFSVPDGRQVKNRAGVLPGIDVRGEGGYIVAPPSLHISGQKYEWEASSDPFEGAEIAALPDALYQLATGYQSDRGPFELPGMIEDGTRNDTLFRLAASLRAKGLSEKAILAAVQEENVRLCKPPLGDAEVRTLCSSAARYPEGDGSAQASAQAAEAVKEVTEKETTLAELTDDTVLRAVFAIKDTTERQRKLNDLHEAARKNHCAGPFNKLVAEFRRNWVKEQNTRGSHESNITGAPIMGLKCGQWVSDDRGVRRTIVKNDGEAVEEWACPHPIMVTERLVNVDTGGEKLKLSYYRDGRWHDVIADKSTLASRQSIINLSDRGIQVNSETARLLIMYLHDVESLNADLIPLHKSVSRLGWVEGGFVPYMEGVKFDGEMINHSMFDAVNVGGDYGVWKRHIMGLREFNMIARAVISGSFAAPLVGLLNKPVFFQHTWGGTGVGKTVVTLAAMSVWGVPDHLMRTFNSTAVALERLAAFCHSIPLALNELQTLRQASPQKFDQIIYQLGEGQGKNRGTKRSGGLDVMSTWRTCILSNGEEPLTSERSGGGAKNRAIELYCPGDQKIVADGPMTAEVVGQNYGHAGKALVAALQAPGASDYAAKAYSGYYDVFNDDPRITEKQAMGAAMLAVADFLANQYIWGMTEAEAMAHTAPFAKSLQEQIAERQDDGDEIDQVSRAYQWVQGWIAINRNRFRENEYTEQWGKMSGFHCSVVSTKLAEALSEAGFSPKKIYRGFAERGLIEQSLEGKNTISTRIGGSLVKCVKFSHISDFEELDDDEEGETPFEAAECYPKQTNGVQG